MTFDPDDRNESLTDTIIFRSYTVQSLSIEVFKQKQIVNKGKIKTRGLVKEMTNRSYPVILGARFFRQKSVFGWQVSAKIGVHLIAKYFRATKS